MEALLKLLKEAKEKVRVQEAALPGKLQEVEDKIATMKGQLKECGAGQSFMLENLERMRKSSTAIAMMELNFALEEVALIASQIDSQKLLSTEDIVRMLFD